MAVTATEKTPLKARYFQADGTAGTARELPVEPFDGIVQEAPVYEAVKAYLANQRQGTASAKTRSAVRGGGRKPWRQKGTGRARHGSIRSPIWRGGGVIFPPSPRSYRHDLPKKTRAVARRSALNARAIDDRVLLIEGFGLESPKTRKLRQLLEKLEIVESKVLLLTDGRQRTVYLSGRNLPNVEIRPYGEESVYDIVWSDFVVIEEGAITGEGAADVSEAEAGEPGASASGSAADDSKAADVPEDEGETEKSEAQDDA